MSKTHAYRIQLHCDRKMHSEVKIFSEKRGLSQSAAARVLLERALIQKRDEVTGAYSGPT